MGLDLSLFASGDEVVFAGAIYDKDVVKALRFYSALYIHGHQVGGTNPSAELKHLANRPEKQSTAVFRIILWPSGQWHQSFAGGADGPGLSR
jgi:hypothetical protein